jgi:hypothetical protein
MFVKNLRLPLNNQLKMQCCTTFFDPMEKGIILEKSLIDQGEIKIYNKNMTNQNPSIDKSKYLAQNRNFSNDRVVDAKKMSVIGSMLTLKVHNTTHVSNETYNAIKKIQNHGNLEK